MSQRSYFIQPKSGSDWSSSAMVSDQEIMNEFEKMDHIKKIFEENFTKS